MEQCNNIKKDGYQCGSFALNEHPETGLCDRCYWQVAYNKLAKKVKVAQEDSSLVDIKGHKKIVVPFWFMDIEILEE